MMNKALFAFGIVATTALVNIGCSGPSYDRTTVTDVSQSGLNGTVTTTDVVLTVGGATKASVKPYDDDNKAMAGEVVSGDPLIIEIAPGIVDGEYFFLGRRIGETTVQFKADGQVVAIARARVTAQGSP